MPSWQIKRLFFMMPLQRLEARISNATLQMLLPFLGLFCRAAAGMPIIIALTLAAGRRGHARLCLQGSLSLFHLALWLWPAGLLFYLCDYFAQVSHYGNSFAEMVAPLAEVAGRPWLSACAAWLAGGALLAAAAKSLSRRLPEFRGDAYQLSALRLPVWLTLAAAASFFLAFCLIHWPFAGLPPDLPFDRAAMAILRSAMRQYFMAFCPAGAVALAALWFMAGWFPRQELPLAIRWTAVWAAAGALPHLLQSWGTLAGLGMGGRLSGSLAQGLMGPTLGLMCLTMAAFVWCWLIWKPHVWRALGLAGFGLLLLATASPLVMRVLG